MVNVEDWCTEISLELNTLADYLRWTVTMMSEYEIFLGYGFESYYEEATSLLYGTLNLPFEIDSNVISAKLLRQEKNNYITNVYKRVVDRIPIPYILNQAVFAGLKFYVDNRVAIPKSSIAELVLEEFMPWIGDNPMERALDLGVGSGCIAVSLALLFENIEVDAVDISGDALAIAHKNIFEYGCQDRINLVQSDLFNNLYPENQYNLIVATPPCLEAQEYCHLPDEYQHEPRESFIAGHSGIEFIMRVLVLANKYLARNGVLIMTVGCNKDLLLKKLPGVSFTWLQFSQSYDDVLLLTYEELLEHYDEIFSEHKNHCITAS